MATKSRALPKRKGSTPAKPVRRRAGRPSLFNQSLAEKICFRLIDGETLRAICERDEFPHRVTVMRWLLRHPEFRAQYDWARQLQADALAEEVISIADDTAGDFVADGEGGTTVAWENVQRSRLRVDSRKWFVAKLAPRKYAERIAQELSGPDGGPIETDAGASLPLPRSEVASAVVALLAEVERELGLPPAKGSSAKARAQRIVSSGGLMPPALYAALHVGRSRAEG